MIDRLGRANIPPQQYVALRELLRSFLRIILHAYLIYQVEKAPKAQHAVGSLLNGLAKKVMKAWKVDCDDDDDATKAQYIKELVAYTASSKRQALKLVLSGSLTHSPGQMECAAAIVGNITAFKAPLASVQVMPNWALIVHSCTSVTALFGNTFVATAAAGQNAMLAYMLGSSEDHLEGSRNGQPYIDSKRRRAILVALPVAVTSSHAKTIVLLTNPLCQYVALYARLGPTEAKPILAAIARAGHKDMLSPVLKATKESEVSTVLLKTACRHGSVDLLRHIVRNDLYDPPLYRGLLRYAVKSRSYAAAKTLLELGFTSNNDGLVNLTIKNSDPHMLKLFIQQGITITFAHAVRAEQNLTRIGYKTVSLEYLLRMKRARWSERTGWHSLNWISHHEQVTSCERRKQKVLTMYLVYKAALAAEPARSWNWYMPLLVKLDGELKQDDFWGEKVERFAAGM